MNFYEPLDKKCAGMDEKYRQVFIDAQKRLLDAQRAKLEGYPWTSEDALFLKQCGVAVPVPSK